MKRATVRLVFDRKKQATRQDKGLVQMEIMYDRKRKWVSTGIKVYKDQWDDRKWVVRSIDSNEYNERLREQVQDMERFLAGRTFSWEALDRYVKGTDGGGNFIDFLEKYVRERNDIRETTRRAHGKLARVLREYGEMVFFSDITKPNILAFDNWLHGRRIRKLRKDGTETTAPMKLPSIYGYHKLMRTYIHIAMNMGLMDKDPYYGLHFQKGASEPGRYLTADELKRLASAEMRSGSIARARDLFVFQCYTGLAYADLRLFDFSKADKEGNDFVYSGRRKKTGEEFFFVILSPAMDILRKYGYKLPVTSSQTYDKNLKKVAEDAGIDKPIASHWARRTAGMMLLNSGVRLETVAKILGHASVKTTEQFYASITPGTVADEMKKVFQLFGKN